MKIIPSAITMAAAIAVISCDGGRDPAGDPTGSTSGKLEAILLDTAPPDAVSIVEARKAPVVGEMVAVTGKIMGREEPFVEGRAMVLLGDPATLVSCDLRPGDDCPTPWDNCCDDPDIIKNSIATIQVVTEDGGLLKEGLRGLGGIKELSSLVVTGTVAEGSGPENLVINATGIHVASQAGTATPPDRE
jgi:hypothetical protein